MTGNTFKHLGFAGNDQKAALVLLQQIGESLEPASSIPLYIAIIVLQMFRRKYPEVQAKALDVATEIIKNDEMSEQTKFLLFHIITEARKNKWLYTMQRANEALISFRGILPNNEQYEKDYRSALVTLKNKRAPTSMNGVLEVVDSILELKETKEKPMNEELQAFSFSSLKIMCKNLRLSNEVHVIAEPMAHYIEWAQGVERVLKILVPLLKSFPKNRRVIQRLMA